MVKQIVMKKLILLLSVGVFLISCKEQETEHYKVLEVAQFEQAISENTVTLIDVRTPEEYQSGHIKSAQNANIQSSDFKAQMKRFDREKPVYIYCRSGARSAKAGKILEEMGFKEVYDLKGGVLAWRGNLEK